MKIKKISKIEDQGYRYDITVDNVNNYFANNILIHNCNISFTYAQDRLWVKSRNQWKPNRKENYSNNLFKKIWFKITDFFNKNIDLKESHSSWWDYAIKHNVNEKLKKYPYLSFYGEYIGEVKGFTYDCEISSDNKIQREFRVFDIFDIKNKKFLEWDQVQDLCAKIGFKTAPILYRGPWKNTPEIIDLAEGKSLIGDHIKEGFVVRTIPMQYESFGRKIFKLKGKDYKLHKGK